MHFEICRETLSAALRSLSTGIEVVRLEADKTQPKRIALVARLSGVEVTTFVRAFGVRWSGACSLPRAVLARVVGAMPANAIEFESVAGWRTSPALRFKPDSPSACEAIPGWNARRGVLVSGGTMGAILHQRATYDAVEVPTRPTTRATVPARALARAISLALDYTENVANHPEFLLVNVEAFADPAALRVMATDGARLTSIDFGDTRGEVTGRAQIDRAGANVIASALARQPAEAWATVEVDTSPTTGRHGVEVLSVRAGDAAIKAVTSDQGAGQFPDFRRVLRRTYAGRAVVEKGAFKSALAGLGVLAEKRQGFNVRAIARALVLSVAHPERGRAEQALAAETSLDVLDTIDAGHYNRAFLAAIVDASPGKTIAFDLSSVEGEPLRCAFDVEGGRVSILVAPMRA